MHLLVAREGSAADDGEAVDLGQTPADVVVLSAADTELSALAFAARRMGAAAPTLRLASFLKLAHPLSVDTYVERTVRHARLVVLRIIGGRSYWPYGLEALLASARANGIMLAVLPGDDKPDAGLDGCSTVPDAVRDRLWRHLSAGGIDNAVGFLKAARSLIDGGERPPEPQVLPKAGRYVSRETFQEHCADRRPVAALVFYRALVQSGQTEAVDALIAALEREGLRALPIFVQSLKDADCEATVRALFAEAPPAVVVNCTGFAVSSPGSTSGTILDEGGAVVLQAVLAGGTEEAWAGSTRGLSARDLAMNVALPEIDGRILARAVAFKSAGEWDEGTQSRIVSHRPAADRVAFTAKLAAAWTRLRMLPNGDKRVAIVLANYAGREGRIGNGVGLDTPAGTVVVLDAMRAAGYDCGDVPDSGAALVAGLSADSIADDCEWLAADAYRAFFEALPAAVRDRIDATWGLFSADPAFDPVRGFSIRGRRTGRVFVGVQPARGRAENPKDDYHDPALAPPHRYVAFYAFLRAAFGADALIHMGKHGNLEWLPGKAMALSADCFPEALIGPVPHLYPFIVNDPGEGTQAKRRTSAVIVDHLTPPLARAELHGPLRDLEVLVDEYYEAAGADPRRAKLLERQIIDLAEIGGLAADARADDADTGEALKRIDAYLCDLKEMQIRDGLHVFGVAPQGDLLGALTLALARLPRGIDPGDASLIRTLAEDLLSETSADGASAISGFDPLDCDFSTEWTGPRPKVLQNLSTDPWRSTGDMVERLETLATNLISGAAQADRAWSSTAAVLRDVDTRLKPSLIACGPAEIDGLLRGLSGRFVAPGSSGAPTRGRPDTLPTGRNFHSADPRAVPTRTAWTLGRKAADLIVRRHLQDHGEWPRAIGLSVWGTSNMRTGGDDIAQALALIGARPVWDAASGRVTGFAVVTLAELGRPRVDVTLRISGFFRDAFPEQIGFFERAVRAIADLEEDAEDNPIAAAVASETDALRRSGMTERDALARAGARVFGTAPGGYGAGLEAVIETGRWTDRGDLGRRYASAGGFAYGAAGEGVAAHEAFGTRLAGLDAIVQNRDNAEHDILDSDAYWQFAGGMAAAVEATTGKRPPIYLGDHSRPERPLARTLEDEIGRVVRGRLTNAKWIAGVMRHGYKGAAEIASGVDMLFAFAATTGAVADHHFDLAHAAFVEDEAVVAFMASANPAAFEEMRERFAEAVRRGLWHPRSNSARMGLEPLTRTEGAP